MKRTICMLVASLHLVGCTTFNAVPYSQGTFEKDPVRQGDKVVIATAGGEHRFVVNSVTPEQICGMDDCIRTEVIESVYRQEFSVLKTAGLVVGLVLIVGAIGTANAFRNGALAK